MVNKWSSSDCAQDLTELSQRVFEDMVGMCLCFLKMNTTHGPKCRSHLMIIIDCLELKEDATCGQQWT